jgi:hypothetical protein
MTNMLAWGRPNIFVSDSDRSLGPTNGPSWTLSNNPSEVNDVGAKTNAWYLNTNTFNVNFP